MKKKTEVLIVGAGKSALSLACQLIRYNVDFVIVDQVQAVSKLVQPFCVRDQVAEIYQQMGLLDESIERSELMRRISVIDSGQVCRVFNMAAMGREYSPYPYLLVIEQSRNEEMLHDYLRAYERPVVRNTTLEHFVQNASHVEAIVRQPDGQLNRIQAEYLVACDQAKDSLRHALGLQFLNDTLAGHFYLADAQVSHDMNSTGVHIYLAKNSFVSLVPTADKKTWRIFGNLPDAEGKAVTCAAVERHIKAAGHLPYDINIANRFSTYRLPKRRVYSFSRQRCLLAGEYFRTPQGRQVVDSSIQDGYNLIWKMAWVLQGRDEVSLLDIYSEEWLSRAHFLWKVQTIYASLERLHRS